VIPVAKPVIGEDEIAAVSEVLRSGMLAGGETVSHFEEAFAQYVGVPHAIATSSGTTGLFAALWSLGLPTGSEVITSPFTFVASANSILYCRHNPVFCDIDKKTFNLSPDSLIRILRHRKNRPRAIILVHLFGQTCDMGSIMEIARENGLKVIEDCAQSHGAKWRGKASGSFGDMGVFSFYPTKNMTTGEGGMVVTDSPVLANKIRMFINHGSRTRYHHEFLGHNFRMTNIAAAIGKIQLGRLDKNNEARCRNAGILNRYLTGVPYIQTPYVHPDTLHVYHQYTLRCPRREDLADYLLGQEIGTGIHYPLPVHKQPIYENLGYGRISLPVAERSSKEVLSLPVHPSLTEKELEYIGQKVGEFYEGTSFSGYHNP